MYGNVLTYMNHYTPSLTRQSKKTAMDAIMEIIIATPTHDSGTDSDSASSSDSDSSSEIESDNESDSKSDAESDFNKLVRYCKEWERMKAQLTSINERIAQLTGTQAYPF